MTYRTFTVSLTASDKTCGSFSGTLEGDVVTCGPLVWDCPTDGHTASAAVQFDRAAAVIMNGNAWREFEDGGSFDAFIQLLALDANAAQKAIEAAEKASTLFRTLVTTSDCTLSQTVYSHTDDEEHILALAKETGGWELNEGNPIDAVYLGSGSDDTEEIAIADYVGELLRDAQRQDRQRREARALELVRSVALLSVWGEAEIDGQSVAPSDGMEDSHRVLMRLIQDARSLQL